MKKIKSACNILLLLSLGILLSCSAPQNVIRYVNHEANFKNYHSFTIVNYKSEKREYTREGNNFLSELEGEIIKAMNDRNYQRQEDADLIVRYETVSGMKTRTSAPNYYGNPYYDPYDPMNWNRTVKYVEGILLIEIKDNKTKKLVWQGSLDLKYSKSVEENRILVKNSVVKIFETYPYAAGSDKKFTPEN